MSTWTEERDAKLKEWLAEGWSFSQVGAGLGVSRNAAIGRTYRLGLKGPLKEPKTRKPRRSKLHPDRIYKRIKQRNPPMIFDNYQPQIGDVVPLNIPFMEIETGQCRYIVGEPDGVNTLFCGHGVVDGLSYCAGHARLCFTAAGTPRPNQGYWRKKTMGIPAKEMVQRVEPVNPDEMGTAA